MSSSKWFSMCTLSTIYITLRLILRPCSLSREKVSISLDKDGITHLRIHPLDGLSFVILRHLPVFLLCMAHKRCIDFVTDGDNGGKRERQSRFATCFIEEENNVAPCPKSTCAKSVEGTELLLQANQSLALVKASTRVAVLVPFRDSHPAQKRQAHLNEFVPYMTKFLQRHCAVKNASFHIFVIEQSPDGRKFNRGKLLNAGFDIARYDYNVFIFHDVDLLPGDELGELYTTIPCLGPVHIARLWERYNESSTYFGGIVAFTSQQFIKVNGFPNNFWGWGGEDNELYSRVMRKKIAIRAPMIGTIRDLEELTLHEKLAVLRNSKVKCTVKHNLLKEHHRTWKKNGLKSLCYEYVDAEAINTFCTKITVKLGLNGHWSDSRSSLEHPIVPSQNSELYSILPVPLADQKVDFTSNTNEDVVRQ